MPLFKPNVGKMKREKDIEGLMKASENKDWKIRGEAEDALREIRIDALIIGKIADARAIETLTKALYDRDRAIRLKATQALGKIRDPIAAGALIKALEHSKEAKVAAADALAEMGKLGVEPIIQAIRPDTLRIRWYATFDVLTDIFVAIGKPAVEPLVQLLKDKSNDKFSYRRIALAVAALGRIGDPSAVEPLIEAADDRRFRNMVAGGLSRIGDTRAVELYVQSLNDESEVFQSEAAEAVGKIGDARAVGPLIQVLKDEHRPVGPQENAAKALGRIGDIQAAEAVIEWLFMDRYVNGEEQSYSIGAYQQLYDWYHAMRTLFGNYTDLILRASIYVKCEPMHVKYPGRLRYDLKEKDMTIHELCNIHTQISSNILHKVSKRKDMKVVTGYGRGQQEELHGWYGTLSLVSERKMAEDELKRRGNPPYDPSAYLDKDSWWVILPSSATPVHQEE
jgi:HEAT repeat protein